MPIWLVKWWKPLAVVAAWVAMYGLISWYGHWRYESGRADEKAKIVALTAAIERGIESERARADAQYRGQVLARQQLEKNLAEAERQRVAAATRLRGLLKQHSDRAKDTGAGGGSDAAGPDWIGIFGECVARAESLGRRLGQVGTDAAGFADQVNGLQGYIRAIQAVQPPRP